MLYDILIIDDVLDKGFTPNTDNRESLDTFDIQKFVLKLIKENLRVTWTTGEFNDLNSLKEKDLSMVQYIFLDLHLQGISEDSSYKAINSKIMGIFKKINNFLTIENVTCFINSKYSNCSNYGKKGVKDLQNKLNKEYSKKYSLKEVSTKNNLSDDQKNILRKNNLNVYMKSLIINKAMDVEKIFDEKLKLSDKAKVKITFESKYLFFQSQYLCDTEQHKKLKKKIQLLQQIRNKLAHTKGQLDKIKDKEMKKTFWNIVKKDDESNPIKFDDFEALMTYISSIDCLCKQLKQSRFSAKIIPQKN